MKNKINNEELIMQLKSSIIDNVTTQTIDGYVLKCRNFIRTY